MFSRLGLEVPILERSRLFSIREEFAQQKPLRDQTAISSHSIKSISKTIVHHDFPDIGSQLREIAAERELHINQSIRKEMRF